MSQVAATPVDVFSRLRRDLFRYYDTPFRLRLAEVMHERRELLDRDAGAWRQPWIEVLRPYAMSGLGVEKVLADAGTPTEFVEFVRCGLLKYHDVFGHQRGALNSIRRGQNVAVTAGTGSGKTEAFLLPILAAVVDESSTWTGTSPVGVDWWNQRNDSWSPQRQRETGRLPGIRALLLYPMNALVEDQLVRLRDALDSQATRQWLDTHRNGHRFFFGRYTGKTPVPGEPSRKAAVTRLRRYLTDTERRAKRVEHDERRLYVPRLDGAEMRSRWDMQVHPPDVLVTNYSMLNIILMRAVDSGLIERTRTWLREDESHVFHVVVDELHMYRGTAGTEVAYLLRQLLRLLDLHPDSPQVRFIATSASLGDTEVAKRFLSDFFGADPASFDVHEGDLEGIDVPEGTNLSLHAERLVQWNAQPDLISPQDAVEWLTEAKARHALMRVAERGTLPLSELDGALFPDAVVPEGAPTSQEMSGLLLAIERGSDVPGAAVPRLRTHLFFRNIDGMWACVDPKCPLVEDRFEHPDRTVGRLWPKPRHRCKCGARVLRLMYCQTCGDLFLGGFVAPSLQQGERLHSRERYLVSELGDLDRIPDQARERETCRDFFVYWPRPVAEAELAVKRSWTRQNYTFEFRPAVVRCRIRRLEVSRRRTDRLDVSRSRTRASKDPRSAVYHRCQSTARSAVPTGRSTRTGLCYDRSRTRSSIRTMGTGYEKVAQVLVDGYRP